LPSTDTEPQVFASHDTVVWNPDMLSRHGHPRERYGDGPFTVISIQQVPTKCSLPGTYCVLGHHHEQCDVATSKSVGHPQWVTLRSPSGEVLLSLATGRDAVLSGAWLVHA
jgi:hypothetical protein